VNWVDKPVAAGDEKSVAGLTAGSSFQDYRIASVGITSRATLPLRQKMTAMTARLVCTTCSKSLLKEWQPMTVNDSVE
jgi:hypothetical protein